MASASLWRRPGISQSSEGLARLTRTLDMVKILPARLDAKPRPARAARPGESMDDLVIRGGHVIDGTGAAGRDADVSLRDGRIVAVTSAGGASARRTIDARGLVVAPGLIDIHTHSDFTLPLEPRAESKIRQGVTTEVVGNCGFSAAPALPGRAPDLAEYLASSAPGLTFRDASFGE